MGYDPPDVTNGPFSAYGPGFHAPILNITLNSYLVFISEVRRSGLYMAISDNREIGSYGLSDGTI